MRTVLDHGDARVIADLHQTIHVTQVAAHVAEHQHLGVGHFLRQIVKVDGQAFSDPDKHRFCPNRRNRTRHRCQREGIGQNRRPRLHPDGPERSGHRIAPRGHGQAIFRAGIGGKFLLQKRGFAQFARSDVITVQTTTLQNRQRGGDPDIGDRLLLGEVSGEFFCHVLVVIWVTSAVKIRLGEFTKLKHCAGSRRKRDRIATHLP